MRKRTVKFILESVIILVICLTPLVLYAFKLNSGVFDEPTESVSGYNYSILPDIEDNFLPYDTNFLLSFGNSNLVISNEQYDLFGSLFLTVSLVYQDYTVGFYIYNHHTDDYQFIAYNSLLFGYDLPAFQFVFNVSWLSEILPEGIFEQYPSLYFSRLDTDVWVLETFSTPIFDRSLSSFMNNYLNITFIDEDNVFYYTFDYFFGETSVFGLNILTTGSLLYIAYVCTVYLAWLVFDFILFIPKLCRKWLCKLTQSE